MSQEGTQQLNAQIDAGLLNQLDELKEKTRVPKKALIEQAIRLLLEQYKSLSAVYKGGVVDQQFMSMMDSVMKQYDETMKKLAK